MLLDLSAKNKVGFVKGTLLKNDDNEVLAAQWDKCNSVVLSWLLSSISEELYSGQIFSATASVVWSELKETYDKVDGSITFNLHQKISSIKQNGSSLSEYYHKLNTLWKQYDEMVKLPECVCTAAPEFLQHNKVLKLMQFLMVLDDVYMSIRSNIFLKDPLPDVKSVFAILSREELHKWVSRVGTSKSQNSAFVAQTNDNSWSNRNSKLVILEGKEVLIGVLTLILNALNATNLDTPLIGVLKFSTTSSSNIGSTNSCISVPMSLSSEQMMKLLSMLNEKGPQTSESVSNMSDSGANQYMTISEQGLDNVVDVSELNLQVSHPNGTKVKVKKIGNLRLNKDIILTDMLIIPGYCDLKTRTTYIHDLKTTTTLGTGSVNGGMYSFDYYKGEPLMWNSVYACNFESVILGHPSSPVLNILKHKLNLDKIVEDIPCETFLKAKHVKDHFPLSDHVTKELGELIHMNL
ncbi:uncharacterized protein [Rutidosis leptorrhynchoides]|uniref:uncharacterized protein n=1 Tax=Rutidosis leptorrhynchoides TaxID=125765 RepID=UPI003A9915DB